MKSGVGRGGVGEIVEVEGGHIVRSTGKKDRHSKVYTCKGPRDRRVRLSAHTAIQFYDVQDRLGYDRPSKAVDWLIKKATSAIHNLAEHQPQEQQPQGNSENTPHNNSQPLGFIDNNDSDAIAFLPTSSSAASYGQDLGLSLHSVNDQRALNEENMFDSLLGHHHGSMMMFPSYSRGTLQSSFSPMLRAWGDAPVASSEEQNNQKSNGSIFGSGFRSGGLPEFRVPARIQGSNMKIPNE